MKNGVFERRRTRQVLQARLRRNDCPGRHHLRQLAITQIGSIIAEAMKKVGKDGVITVEESKTMETQLETGRGYAV